MAKLWLTLSFVLGSSLLCWGQTPAAPAADDRCEQLAQAYENQRAVCADYNEQLSHLKLLIGELDRQKKMCEEGKVGKDSSVCDELNGLLLGRRAILQQQYDNLAQRGCSQPVDVQSIYRECAPATKSTEIINSSNRKPTQSAASSKAVGKASTPASDHHHEASSASGASVRGQVRMSDAPQSAAGSPGRSLGGDRGPGGGFSGGLTPAAGNSTPSPNATAGASRPK